MVLFTGLFTSQVSAINKYVPYSFTFTTRADCTAASYAIEDYKGTDMTSNSAARKGASILHIARQHDEEYRL